MIMDMVDNMDNRGCLNLWKIITEYGYRAQKEKAVEELCELATELARDIQGAGRRDAITEEMADVYVVLAQLMLMFGNEAEVRRVIGEKIARTLKRMGVEDDEAT